MRARGLPSLALLLMLGTAPSAWPADAVVPARCTADNHYDSRLDNRYSKSTTDRKFSCLTGKEVFDRLDEVQKAFYGDETLAKSGSPAPALQTAWPQTALVQLRKQQEDAQKLSSIQPASFAAALRTYQDALAKLVQDVASLKSLNDWPTTNVPEELLPGFWSTNATARSDAGGAAATYLTAENCLAAELSSACSDAYDRALRLADQTFIVSRIISIMTEPQRATFAAEAAVRTTRWHSYLYDASFQYWWELALNRYAEVKCPALLRWECTPPATDSVGNEVGFRNPPSHKLAFLHPDVGIEYLSREAAGQRIKPALLFQWLGYESWSWSKDNAVDNEWGISLVTSVADTTNTGHIGTGIQLQYKSYALAVTAHGSYVGVSINLKLMDKLGTVNPTWADKLKSALPK